MRPIGKVSLCANPHRNSQPNFKIGHSDDFTAKPAAVVILITGAGGACKQLLVDSGAGKILAELMIGAEFPLLILVFLIAAVTRIAQDS